MPMTNQQRSHHAESIRQYRATQLRMHYYRLAFEFLVVVVVLSAIGYCLTLLVWL